MSTLNKRARHSMARRAYAPMNDRVTLHFQCVHESIGESSSIGHGNKINIYKPLEILIFIRAKEVVFPLLLFHHRKQFPISS